MYWELPIRHETKVMYLQYNSLSMSTCEVIYLQHYNFILFPIFVLMIIILLKVLVLVKKNTN